MEAHVSQVILLNKRFGLIPPLSPLFSLVPRSFHWLPRRSNTPPAFLEPQPQTTMDQQQDSIRHPRPHRLSLSSLSSISTDSSFEDDHYTPQQQDMPSNCASDYLDCPPLVKQQEQQQEQRIQYRTILPISQINNTPASPGEVASPRQPRQYQLPQVSSRYGSGLVTAKDHSPHVANAIDHSKSGLRMDSLSPRSSIDNINLQQQSHDLSSSVRPDPLSTDTSLSTDSSPSPSSPVPSSLLTFWASPTISTEQQHEFVTKNAHIKRPRNAWIHVSLAFCFQKSVLGPNQLIRLSHSFPLVPMLLWPIIESKGSYYPRRRNFKVSIEETG